MSNPNWERPRTTTGEWLPGSEPDHDTVCRCEAPLKPLIHGSACRRCNRVVMAALRPEVLERAELLVLERQLAKATSEE